MLKNKFCKTFFVYLAVFLVLGNQTAWGRGLVPQSWNQMYKFASQGKINVLKMAVDRGLDIDTPNEDGDTGLCVAIKRTDYRAYNSFRAAGADPRPACINEIAAADYDNFMNSDRIPAFFRQGFNSRNYGVPQTSSNWKLIGGLILLGGVVAALLLSGGGGGGGGHYIPSTPAPDPEPEPEPEPEPTPDPDDNMASQAGTGMPSVGSPTDGSGQYQPIIKKVEGSAAYTNSSDLDVQNTSTNDVSGTQTPISEILNWNDNSILQDAEFLRVGIKATEGSEIINAADNGVSPVITVWDASIGMAAEDQSFAKNQATIEVNAHNAAIGMAASSSSLASNQSGANLNMTMTGGYVSGTSKTRIIGMYADTGASVSNDAGATITGENKALSGTMVGMQASLVNAVNETTKAVNEGTINLFNSSTVTPTSSNVTLIGMDGVFDKALSGVSSTNIKGATQLSNNGTITLSSNWDRTSTLIGMRTGSFGTATNGASGTIQISGSGVGTVTGMQASGGDKSYLNNEGTLDISGADFTGYGMQGYGVGVTATNKNIIKLNTSDGAGMYAEAGADIVNSSAGVIEILNGGIGMRGDGAGNIENDGTINMSQNSIGIKSQGATKVRNEGTINMNAGGTGMRVEGGYSVFMDGNINVTGEGIGIDLISTGLDNLSQKGKITITGDNSIGINAKNSSSSDDIDYSGQISVTGKNAQGIVTENSFSSLDEGSSTLNFSAGEITVSGDNAIGVNSKGNDVVEIGSLMYSNVTKVNATGLDAVGVQVNEGFLTVAKNATVEADGENSYGIRVLGENVKVSVASGGTVNAKGDNTTAVFMAGSGSISNSGAIVADGLNNIGISALNPEKIPDGGTAPVPPANPVTVTNSGNITLKQNGVGITAAYADDVSNDAAGVITLENGGTAIEVADSDVVENRGKIVISAGGGTGIDVSNIRNSTINTGTIDITGDDSVGMKSSGGSLVNGASFGNATIKIAGNNAKGMYFSGAAQGGNEGKIEITGDNGIGMYATETSAAGVANTERGEIVITGKNGIGMFADGYVDGADGDRTVVMINKGKITITSDDGSGEGLRASGSKTTIRNDGGTIMVNGVADTAVHLSNGASYVNNGLTKATKSMNFDNFGDGRVEIGKNGRFEAPELAGEVYASADIVSEGNQSTYVAENAFVGEDKGISLNSGSYMFRAALRENDTQGKDVVMIMKSFAEVAPNASTAAFLEQNYALGTNGGFYSVLKSAPTAALFNSAAYEQLGLNFFPVFAKQNLDIVKGLNRKVSEEIFADLRSDDERVTVGVNYGYRDFNGADGLLGYEDQAVSVFGVWDRKYDNSFRYGIGLSATDFDSDYDRDYRRDEAMLQVTAPLFYRSENVSWLTMPRFGYGFGEYKRYVDGAKIKADTRNLYYGVSNEYRQEFTLGGIVLEPVAEFNVLGLHQQAVKEKGRLKIEAADDVSVESGLGLYLKKTWQLDETDELKLRAGGTWYHEFNNSFQNVRAHMAGMVGSYEMDGYSVERDRGILSVRADYKHGEFDVYFSAEKFLEEDDGYALNFGAAFRF